MPAKSAQPAESSKPRRAPTRKRAGSSRASNQKRRPDHSAIAERAYFIHLEEGSPDEVENWLRAERELTAA
jgi:Protein of unknown function (DUF2934)